VSGPAISFVHDDKLHEECGVFGVHGVPDAAALTALGLHALQHRGQEGAGIVAYDGEIFNAEKRIGLVGDHFTKRKVIDKLPGDRAIGHVRYSTAGGANIRNVQPLFADLSAGGLAVAHNGNITNAESLRQQLVGNGAIFQSTSDTEVILHLVAQSEPGPVRERIASALRKIEGAYSLVALTNKKMIGVRDPLGVRPLVLGTFEGGWVLASETCAFDIMGASYERDIEPGEMVIITDDGIESLRPFPESASRFCIFEYVYFARPDSVIENRSVYEARKQIGRELARECPADVDLVVPVPDSGVPAAIGFAQEANIPFELGIIRNHYVGRTFIEPEDQIRHLGVKLKHNASRAQLEGKKVVLVDDSIVRGTTSMKIVELVREAGAKEVHMRIAAPPTMHPCFYGVDTPESEQLLAHRHTIEEIGKIIQVDSIGYLSMDGLYRAVGESQRNNDAPQFCDACFSGEYPTTLTDRADNKNPSQLSLLVERAAE
jgi:amidophosphoribosyltransferase